MHMASMVVDYRQGVGQHEHAELKAGEDRYQTSTGRDVRHVKPPLKQPNEKPQKQEKYEDSHQQHAKKVAQQSQLTLHAEQQHCLITIPSS